MIKRNYKLYTTNWFYATRLGTLWLNNIFEKQNIFYTYDTQMCTQHINLHKYTQSLLFFQIIQLSRLFLILDIHWYDATRRRRWHTRNKQWKHKNTPHRPRHQHHRDPHHPSPRRQRGMIVMKGLQKVGLFKRTWNSHRKVTWSFSKKHVTDIWKMNPGMEYLIKCKGFQWYFNLQAGYMKPYIYIYP